jgi:hypothetical protein
MKYVFIIFTIMLSGCSTVIPTTAKFPDAPHELFEKCPQLKLLDTNDPSIISMSKTIVENYTMYHQCSNKVNSWIEWHTAQKNANDAYTCLHSLTKCK